MSPTAKLVMDSLTPMQAMYGKEFFDLTYRKNRLLRHPGVTIFDTVTNPGSGDEELISMTNLYDVVLNLFTPDWGDMASSSSRGLRAMSMTKARGAIVDPTPVSFTINQEMGIDIRE